MSFILFFALTTGSSPEIPAPAIMQQFLHHLVALQPYMASKEKFISPSEARSIAPHLKALSELSGQIDHSMALKKSGYQITGAALQKHLRDLNTFFTAGKKDYSHRMLTATIDGCASCHTQMPAKGLQWNLEEMLPQKISKFSKAEFLFSTRHWDRAMDISDDLLLSKNANLTHSQWAKLLEMKLAYFLRLKRDPQAAIQNFEVLLTRDAIPKKFKSQISDWLPILRLLVLQKAPNPKKANAEKIVEYVEQLLGPAKKDRYLEFGDNYRVSFLYASGILYEFLDTRDEDDLSPDLFYWLAFCDEYLNRQFFFSLSDNYLRECVERFPKTKTAHRCFDEWVAKTRLAYTGSSGEYLPEDVQKEMEDLRSKLR